MIIFVGSLDADGIGEIDVFFDQYQNIIKINDHSDAKWRDEYFNDMLHKVGIEVERIDFSDCPKKLQRVMEYLGF